MKKQFVQKFLVLAGSGLERVLGGTISMFIDKHFRDRP